MSLGFASARSALAPARLAASLFALALLLVAGGCAGSGRATYDSAEEAYQQGVSAYDEGDYKDAIEYFNAVVAYGRDGEWADDAQLYLGRAYREDGRHLLAAQQFDRFVQLYRGDERVPEAEYQRAMSYYRRSPDYDLDQTYTRQALSRFLLFSERYSTHERAAEADERIAELRGKLARKKLAAARQYERRELWEAAAHAFEAVFDQYPDTRWVDDALLGAVRTNVRYAERSVRAKQSARYRRAIDSYRRLEQIFSDSPFLDQARPFYETAVQRLEVLEAEQNEPLAGADEETTE